MTDAGNKVYFPGLNGLRFFAALLVIIHHVEFVKGKLGLPNHMNIIFFQKGNLGVVLFFVLSGFLITYLLLQENRDTGRISIRRFYFKRMLRIWPLYYLMVAGVFIYMLFAGKTSGLAGNVALYLFILPNLAFVLFPPVEGIYHLWTIGVEEQFYLLWPLKLKYIKKYILPFLLLITLFFPLLRIVVLYFYKFFPDHLFYVKFTQFVLTLQFECMAVGGAFAYFLFCNKVSLLKFIFSIPVQVISCILIVYNLFYDFPDFYFNSIFISVLFGILIINVGANKRSIIQLENMILNFLGKISYGLYVYHLIIIYLVIQVSNNTILTGVNTILLHCIVTGITIGLSSASYYLFEKKMLAFKETI